MRLGTIITVGALAGTAFVAYRRFLRWTENWGATPDEIERPMLGDDIVENPGVVTTRAVTIAAPPSSVWPWLAQMGPAPRGGAYTYDWIENIFGLNMHSVDEVLPEYQDIKAGDTIGEGEMKWVLRIVEPEKFLVIEAKPGAWSWAFGLYHAEDGSTRLVSRNRIAGSGPQMAAYLTLMDPGSLLMERKMLLGIKQRAEKLHEQHLHMPVPEAVR